jgi:general stress protein 26
VTDDRPDSIAKLRDLTDGIDVAMLTTIGYGVRLQSRPMMTQQVTGDGEIWFFTRAESAKTHDLDAHPDVNVAYADSGRQRYVSVAGRARLVRSREKARELWNPAYRAWFPDGLDDPDLALIAVAIESAEYWDSGSSTMVHLAGFVKGLVTGQRYTPGEHGHITPPARGD